MTLIAEAFVLIRPDLKGFADELRTELNTKIGQVKAPTITLKPVLDRTALAAIKQQLTANPIKIPVTPTLSPGSTRLLRNELRAIVRETIPINVALSKTSASRVGAQVARETQAAQTAAAAAAAAPARTPAGRAGGVVPAQSAAEKAAAAAAAKQAADLARIQFQVAEAARLARTPMTNLAEAEARLGQVEGVAAAAGTSLRAERLKGTEQSIAAIAALKAEADATLRLSEARVAVLRSRATTAGLDPIRASTPVPNLKDAQTAAKAASTAFTEAQAAQTLAATAGNNALKKQADQLVITTGRANEAAAAQLRLAEAEQARVPLLSQIATLETRAAALSTAAAARGGAAAAATAGLKLQEDVTKRLTAAQAAGDDRAVKSLELLADRVALTTAAAAAETHLRNAQVLRAEIQGGSVGAGASSAEVAAARELAAANAAVVQSELALDAAIETGDQALIKKIALEKEATVALQEHTAAALRDAESQAAQLPFLTQKAAIERTIASAVSPGGVTAGEQARAAVTASARASRQAIALQDALTNSKIAGGAAEIAQAEALVVETAALNANAVATAKAIAVEQKHVTSMSQAQRGALGTSASFLGLRGAILSSSGPFLAATIAVTAFSKVVGQASQLQQSLNVFQATTAATAEQMKEVTDTAKELGADLSLPATSANDAATAMTELAKAGLDVDNVIGAARGTLQLSAAASISAGEAAKIAATELNAFGLAGDQAGRVTNLLAAASIAAQGEIGDFGAAFQQASAQAKQSGVSVEQTTTLLTQLARAGIRGSDAGTSLRVELLRLVPGTKAAQDGFRKLGIQIDQTATIGSQLPSIIQQFSQSLSELAPQAQTAVLRDIFGQDASRAAIITLTQGAAAFQAQQAALEKSGQAASLTEAKAKGLSGSIAGLSSNTENLATTLGADLLPALTAVAQELSSVVKGIDQMVEALNPAVALIGDLATGFGLFGGGVVARIGLVVAAAFGLNKALVAIAARRTAADIAAKESAVAQVAANDSVTASLRRIGDAQVFVATESGVVGRAGVLAAEEQIAANNAVAASEKRLADAKRRRLLAGGLIAGATAATIAGDAIGGPGGGILSGAGQGAALGFLVGGAPGAVVGGIAGGAISAMTSISAETEAERQKAKTKWDSLTFVQQQALKASNPRLYAAMVEFAEIKDKPNPFQGTFFKSQLPSRPSLPRTFVAPGAGAGIAGDVPGLVSPGNININNRPPVPFGNALATVRSITIEQDGLFKLIPTVINGQVVSNQKAIEAFNKGGQNLGTFDTEAAAERYAKILHKQQEGMLKILSPDPSAIFGGTVFGPAAIAEAARKAGDPGPAAKIALAIAQGTLSGDDDVVIKALRQRLENQQLRGDALERLIHSPENKNTSAQQRALVNELEQNLTNQKKTQDDIAALLDKAASDFSPRLARIDLAAARAEQTKSLADNLAAQRQRVTYYQGLVDIARKALDDTKKSKQRLLEAQIALQGESNKVTSIQDQIAADAAQAAADQASAQLLVLERVAAAAGNQGKAEAALLAELEKRRDAAKGNALKFQQATNDLLAAQEQQRQAIAETLQLRADLRNAIIDTARAAAALTTGTADDVAVLQRQKSEFEAELRRAQKTAADADQGTKAWLDAKIKVQNLKTAIKGVEKEIKDMKAEAQGTSPAELFKTAISDFLNFGSNIGAAGTPTSRQDARGIFAGTVLGKLGAPTDVIAAVLRGQGAKAEGQRDETNKILQGILDKLSNDGNGIPSKSKKPPARNIDVARGQAEYLRSL